MVIVLSCLVLLRLLLLLLLQVARCAAPSHMPPTGTIMTRQNPRACFSFSLTEPHGGVVAHGDTTGGENGAFGLLCYNPCTARITERLTDIVDTLPRRDVYGLVGTQSKAYGEQ
eukprot:5316199-Pyramimonas_sp.AAC.1